MPIVTTNFIAGRMNKSVDERLVPPGEYINAINVRLGSTETTEIGAVENSKGNTRLTTLQYNGADLTGATCIGAYEDGAYETMYWFITSATVDMVVSFNTKTGVVTYHVISLTVLNFNPQYLITGVDKIGDMLFWTDDINPPRKINVTRNYPNPVGAVDGITAADINVIVHPPVAAPTLSLITQATEANYMETRMISFAYRYKYKDDEYSALSQFTDIAFIPGVFLLDVSTNLNSGMKNIYNAVEISFNTGSDNVVAIDLIFKFADSTLLNVIEKFNKADFGWPPNSIQTQVFSNSKIYTILSSNELLRLYDNVPRFAKAQTIMGNRLVYGNYVDGYDLIDSNNQNSHMEYTAALVSEDIEVLELPSTYDNVNYTIGTPISIGDSGVTLDLSSINSKLKTGALLYLDFTFTHSVFNGNDGSVESGSQQGTTPVSTIFTLSQDFSSVYDMASSAAFEAKIGSSIAYFQTVANCALGTSFTDAFNCAITQNIADTDENIEWTKNASGITGTDQGFDITTLAGSDLITLIIPAMQFVDTEGAAAAPLYEYYKFTNIIATFISNGNTQSLHSNRNYEVGIVYMDEYLRSSTALVSPHNTVSVPASNLTQKNSIKIDIPITQRPPYWATRYKFVVKRAEGPYETIYSNFYYMSDITNTVFFRLQGQNQNKAKVGDLLRIKADNYGPLSGLVTNEILSIESKEENFITPAANVITAAPGGGGATIDPYIAELAGLYMEMKPTNFNIDFSEATTSWSSGTEVSRSLFAEYHEGPDILIPCFRLGQGAADNVNLAIPVGSLITFDIEFHRRAKNSSDKGSKIYNYNRTFAASQDYDTLWDFVNGESIDFTGGVDTSTDDSGANTNTYTDTIRPGDVFAPPYIQYENQYQFTTTTGAPPSPSEFLYLGITSGSRGWANAPSEINGRISVQLSNTLIVFETTPIDVDTDIYYEDDSVYDITNDFHMSGTAPGDRNQTDSFSAIVSLGFFDCFAFGNGVESYKVQDSLVGQSFTLGQRVTSVSEQDYKESDRYAGLTYSGVYNEETNINRLNEFNLGLANFKDLEVLYGPIQILHSRETDILTLQEDKISYVQTNKDVLTTAAGGGAVSSSPLILGQQVARIEEYGISDNAESFVAYGPSMYFTDAKRSAVLQLKGISNKVALNVISDIGMRSYFRDLFTTNFITQKLGGYDPYMDEYVLASSIVELPSTPEIINCGITVSQQVVTGASTYTLEMGSSQGVVTFSYVVSGTVQLLVVWNSGTVINSSITGTGTATFTKNLSSSTTATFTLTPTGTVSYDVTPSCPATCSLEIVQIAVGSAADSGKFIHDQYYWTDSTATSPVSEELISFGTGVFPTPVESFISTLGQSSIGLFPPTEATIKILSNKLTGDDFVFDSSVNKFKYLVSDTAYTAADFSTIDAASTTATPITNPSAGLYETSFTYTNTTCLKYLYMIWDYRTPTPMVLRYGATAYIACCSGLSATFYIDTPSFKGATAVWTDATLSTPAANQFYQTTSWVREQDSGELLSGKQCEPCGTAIPLCYSDVDAVGVCCTKCTYTAFTSSIMKSLRSEACALSQTETYYHNGIDGPFYPPVVNNFVFSDSEATTILSAGYYSLSATSVIYVNSSGMVEELLTC